jgi:DNA-binding transcriptional LysR family regulator
LISRLAVADELAQGRLCEVPLRGINAPRPIYLLIHRDKHRTPALRAFQALVPPLAPRDAAGANGRGSTNGHAVVPPPRATR